MSCEGHRGKFFGQVAQDPKVQGALGGQADDVMERIFQQARSQPVLAGARQQMDARTQALFDEMRKRGIKPPTHSHSGLPKPDARAGYAAVHATLEAIRNGGSLPAAARQVLGNSFHRKLSAVGLDKHGLLRCGNCGRFAPRNGDHLCPVTATAEGIQRALKRRLGLPTDAYGQTSLTSLLDDARAEDGTVTMRHNLTGEMIAATLDGLPLALATGFLPEGWQKQATAVELSDGRIVSVLNPAGLSVVRPANNAHAAAAQAYGLAHTGEQPAANAAHLPPVSFYRVQDAAQTSVNGGQPYNWAHFIGTEYRKKDSHGAQVTVYGHTYTVGARSTAPEDQSSARRTVEQAGSPKGGIVVGRTLVAAMGLLATGEVVETSDGQIQLYDRNRANLLAVYDPKQNLAGDTTGNPNASAEQMAAVVAHHALHPQNPYDYALALDLARMHEGTGTPLAAADGAYLVLAESLRVSAGALGLGGHLAASRCPKCGRFAGDAHICPAGDKQPEQPSAPPVETSVPTPVTASVNVTVDTAPIADALRDIPAPEVQIDAEKLAGALQNTPAPQVQAVFDAQAFAKALREELTQISPAAANAIGTEDVQELRSAVLSMAQAIEGMARNQPLPTGGAAAQIVAQTISPTENTTPPTRAGRCPKCGQFAGQDHVCPPRQPRVGRTRPADLPTTSQEHILSPVVLPAPDPYLANVPAHIGGDLYQAIAEDIPAPDPNFELNEQTERALSMMSAMLQAGAGKPRNGWSRAFGLYGPPGTGKNTLARQLAASVRTRDADGKETQGMNYIEANITPESSMQELIGATVLTTDPESGATVSRVQLGKIGLAAAMGSVICVNEIVRSPKLATALQSMIEDGEIQVDSPEGGIMRIPVHPSTIFVTTWNPGNEGDPDRPAGAPLSRMITMRLDRPSLDEQKRRLLSMFAGVRSESSAISENEARRNEINQRSFAIDGDLNLSDVEAQAATMFVNDLSTLASGGMGGRLLAVNSPNPVIPGPRELFRFAMLGKTTGWKNALEMFRVYCDQDSDLFSEQWALVEERFGAYFGTDGGAIGRAA